MYIFPAAWGGTTRSTQVLARVCHVWDVEPWTWHLPMFFEGLQWSMHKALYWITYLQRWTLNVEPLSPLTLPDDLSDARVLFSLCAHSWREVCNGQIENATLAIIRVRISTSAYEHQPLLKFRRCYEWCEQLLGHLNQKMNSLDHICHYYTRQDLDSN